MNLSEFNRRRRKFFQHLESGDVAIIPTSPILMRSNDVDFPYRPNSDFYYLSGFAEPEAVLILYTLKRKQQMILFCLEKDEAMETWHGRRAGLEQACVKYGADDAFAIQKLDELMPELLEDCRRVYYTFGDHLAFDTKLIQWVTKVREKARSGIVYPTEFHSVAPLLHSARLIKSPAEITTLRKAVKVTREAHIRAMQMCRPGLMEYEIEAELLHVYKRYGCVPSYNPIVGAGENSCILHYTQNKSILNEGDLLLIDSGAEYEMYAADITRTFPVSGKFTPAQRELYQLVLDAQLAAIAKVKPGSHWNEPHEEAVKVLVKGLLKLGLLKGNISNTIKEERYRKFYMHKTGHWLGMDVHDVGTYKSENRWRRLEPGMVMTVEPGLYIPAGTSGVAKKWWNIGIRIEDNVVVTNDGNNVLSAGIPKTVDEIEKVMS